MKRNSPSQELALIAEMVAPLDAPVKAFEQAIRTTPLRTLISVLLSSRTQDPVTLEASKRLFDGVESERDLAELSVDEIARRIYPVGFFRQKALQIKEISRRLVSGEKIRPDLDWLQTLPGVGRKTANLVLSLAFNQAAIAVDIHVFRISRRLGWAQGEKPEKVEAELKGLFDPSSEWSRLNQILVAFGQTLCRPVKPKCPHCRLRGSCPSAEGQ